MMIKYLLVVLALFILEILYIKFANLKNIKDNPNHRSAHSVSTIRGGGIIVFFSIILYFLFFKSDINFIYFLAGVFLVSIISFIDDLIMLSSKARILVHFLAFSLIFYSLDLFEFSHVYNIIILIIIYVFSIGFLNIYNFMDGINGITFLNGLVSYSTLLYLNQYYLKFTDSNLLIILIIAISVFGFFNFRKKAICFAGDIGSITIGFSLIYFALKFYLATNNVFIFLLFSIYLLDGGLTIFERLFRKENIFDAHKRHLYQILVNEFKIQHLSISSIYFLVQLLMNCICIFILYKGISSLGILFLIFSIISVIYIYIKNRLIKKINEF